MSDISGWSNTSRALFKRVIEVDLDTDAGCFTNAGAAVCFYGLFNSFWQWLVESSESHGS